MEFICCCLRTKNASKELACCKCNDNYHIRCIFHDKEETWTPDKKFLSSWLCPKCTRGDQRDNRDETPMRQFANVAKVQAETSPSHLNVTLRKNSTAKREDLVSISKETLRSIIREEINVAFSNINSTLIELKTEVTDLQNSVKFMSEKYDSLIERISCVEEKTKAVSMLELEIRT
ncbi:unnamed protein product [Arctia plantaginis]|uniref:PHD-type domain-containing protein n=1 Tax=Arctia plantaginis TaxID=874455 RepID=A0A8S0ZCP7_ARCPL|nr:unnamed protein product [Arctia plantaginis]